MWQFSEPHHRGPEHVMSRTIGRFVNPYENLGAHIWSHACFELHSQTATIDHSPVLASLSMIVFNYDSGGEWKTRTLPLLHLGQVYPHLPDALDTLLVHAQAYQLSEIGHRWQIPAAIKEKRKQGDNNPQDCSPPGHANRGRQSPEKRVATTRFDLDPGQECLVSATLFLWLVKRPGVAVKDRIGRLCDG